MSPDDIMFDHSINNKSMRIYLDFGLDWIGFGLDLDWILQNVISNVWKISHFDALERFHLRQNILILNRFVN